VESRNLILEETTQSHKFEWNHFERYGKSCCHYCQ